MKIDELNNEQQKAVFKVEGPTLILAGAGSGKTKVLTTKIAYLIEKIGVSPYNVLAITFTNKAAKEMNDRLYHMIGEISKKIQVSTFHSFGLKILRENSEHLGYKSNFLIMDSEDTLSIIKKILKGFNLDPKQYNPSAIRNKISGCKNELMDPDSYEKYAISDFEEVVLKVYRKYQETLFKNNSIDFDDLLILPIKLFREHPSILQKYQERFQYILIDEYQDTNEAQYILTKMISAKYKNICCVGDNDQSIYSFRGANYRNILNFEKDYSDATVIKLEQNYRSTTNILDAANNVIKNNRERKDKNLWSNKGTGKKISYFRAFNERDEAFYVTREIKKLLNKGIDYKDIAILYRTNAQSRNMEEELLKENLPYRVVGSFYFYSRKEIKDLIAYLRLIHNSDDDMSLLRVINTPKRGIGLKTLKNLDVKAELNGTSLFEAIDSGKELEFKKLILDLKKISENLTLTELVDKILDVTGIRKEYEDEHSLEADIRIENLEEFKTITKTFEEREGVISLEDFLLEISLVSDVNEYKDDKNRISLMTVHSVKGLEFDYVFVIGLEEGIFPHINSLMDNSELEEERRLCYVAITRAREKLHIVNARTRTIYGKESSNPPSRFIKEMKEELLEKEFKDDPENTPKVNKEEFFHQETVDYKIGDFVYHENFGHGKVVEVTNTLLSIAFKHPYGIKKLMKNHKSIKKYRRIFMDKNKTLVIMAAGMGSRFGGLKQIEPIGPNGEFIIDYSIYDAIMAGFNRVVFIIKEENFDIFKETVGNRVSNHIKVDYVFQKIDNVPDGFVVPEGRVKPWGTSHAIMSCQDVVNEDFIVLNSDDFYGRDAFMAASKFLEDRAKENLKEYAVIGYNVANTLTENGSVKRGVCELKDNYLTSIIESKVEKIDGKIIAEPLDGRDSFEVAPSSSVSMNFFAFTPDILDYLKNNFASFLERNKDNLDKCEYLIPESVFAKMQEDGTKVRVVDTTAKWYGVTYKEDKESVVNAIRNMIDNGDYPTNLWK